MSLWLSLTDPARERNGRNRGDFSWDEQSLCYRVEGLCGFFPHPQPYCPPFSMSEIPSLLHRWTHARLLAKVPIKLCVIEWTPIVQFFLYEMSRRGKPIGRESRWVGVQGWEQREQGVADPKAGGIFSGWCKCSGIRQWRWPHNIVNVLQATEMYTL